MGAVYDVVLNMKYTDDQDIIDLTEEFVNRTSNFVDYDADFTSFESALGTILPKRGLNIKFHSNGRVDCDCGFDASYGWGGVIKDWFEYLAPVLKDNSTISVYIWDEGEDFGTVRGGAVEWTDGEPELESVKPRAEKFIEMMQVYYPEISLINSEVGTGDNSGYIIMNFDLNGNEIDPELADFLDDNTYTWYTHRLVPGGFVVYCKE